LNTNTGTKAQIFCGTGGCGFKTSLTMAEKQQVKNKKFKRSNQIIEETKI
jgi:hypothetical protein